MVIKYLAIMFLFTGCATRVYEGGLPVLAVYSNTTNLSFRSVKGTTLTMTGADNSTPTRVGLDGITKGAVAIGTALLSHGASSAVTSVVKK